MVTMLLFPKHVIDLAQAYYQGVQSARDPFHDALLELGIEEENIIEHFNGTYAHCVTGGCALAHSIVLGDIIGVRNGQLVGKFEV